MRTDDANLIQRFVATFERLDDLIAFHDAPPPNELSAGIDPDDWNVIRWRPAPLATPDEALSVLHDRVLGRLPRLYERLILSYRWLEVDLRLCRLLANPPAAGLQPLVDRMFADPVLNNTLIHSGFIRFALAPDACYDPICFDLNRSVKGDCPVVRFNHESILVHGSLGDVEQIFRSFRDLMLAVLAIDDA